MNTRVFDLEAAPRPSRVLGEWLARDPAAAARAGLVPAPRAEGFTAVSSDADAMRQLFQPLGTSSGFAVTDHTAMLVSTVYACLSVLAGAVLQLPVHQYRIDARGDRERMAPTALWWLLNESPDDAWTSAAWKEWIVRCWGLRGDQVTEIVRDQRPGAAGAVKALRPHHPDCVAIVRNGRRLRYDIFDPLTNTVRGLDQDDVLHFTGFGFDGRSSLSVVQWAARNAIGNALAGADYVGRTVGEGAMPQIALSSPAAIKRDQAKNLRDAFVATYTGGQARKLPLVLEGGMDVKVLSIKPVDMELMAQRGFEKDDICEAIGVPAVLIGRNEKTTSWGTGVEQITLGFVRYRLKPLLCRWEEELNRKLFRRAGTFVEFNLDALMRGDSKAQADYYRAAIGGPGTGDGWMAVDEVRKLQNMAPLGGDSSTPFRAVRATTTPSPTPPAA